MSPPRDLSVSDRFGVIHLQKTAGGSLRTHLRRNFAPDEIFPGDSSADPMDAYLHTDALLALTPAQHEKIRVYCGHWPARVFDILDQNLVEITLVREPVERTMSYLKMATGSGNLLGVPPEEIYDNAIYFEGLICNYQAKLFCYRDSDDLQSQMSVVQVDDQRLSEACARLEQVSVIGRADKLARFYAELTDRFGWQIDRILPRHRSKVDWSPSDSFRRRVASDLERDIEFYEFALALIEKRRLARRVRHQPAT